MDLISQKFVSLVLALGLVVVLGVNGAPEGIKFPESAPSPVDETSNFSDASSVIDEIVSASRAGRNLRLTVGDEDLEPLASDPELISLSSDSGKEEEARSYVASKLCSLGLAKCNGDGSEAEGRHGGQYGQGLHNLRDVTLVQPVALKPVGHPIAAIPLQKQPFGPIGTDIGNSYDPPPYGNYQSENKNYPTYQSQQGGLISSQDCTCVHVSQCNSYDIVLNGQPSNGNGIISGGGNNGRPDYNSPNPGFNSGRPDYGNFGSDSSRPDYGNVGLGIDPRNKKSEIESNATVVEAPSARITRSHGAADSINNASSAVVVTDESQNATRTKREAPLLPGFNNPRIINGGYKQQCYDSRSVCCRNPIRNPNGQSPYPGTPSYRPSPPVYPGNNAQPTNQQYYPPSSGSSGSGTCGRRNPNGINGRVLNGDNIYGKDGTTEFGEYPWQVAILKKDGANNIFVCGGSIIDSRHVLTAAHCIKSNRPEDLQVRLGEWDVNAENEFYPHIEVGVAAIAIHPEFYAGNLINDLAIVKLNGFVDFNKYPHISPICLPTRYNEFTGIKCYATGWGKDAFGQGGKFQKILQEVDVPVVDSRDCEQRLRRTRLGPNFSLHKGFLCAGGEPEKDACKGDGGGPLSCEVGGTWQLAGIVSWGVGCGNYGTPGVYVKTSHYLDWIRQTIQN